MHIQHLREKILSIVGLAAQRRRLLAGELERFKQTLSLIDSKPGGALLGVGACGDLVPAYRDILGFTKVECLDASGPSGVQRLEHESGAVYMFNSHRLNLECDPFPFPDASFDQVVAMEVLEHLAIDPMFMLAEINRVLKPGGHLVLTTPNINALPCLYHQLWGKHPAIGRQCYGPGTMDRHHREYALHEVGELARAAGFDVETLDTFTPIPNSKPVQRIGRLLQLLSLFRRELPDVSRGSVIRLAATKVDSVVERFPEIVYPRYSFYDYPAYDRDLTKRFGGRRYWRTDVAIESDLDDSNGTSSEFVRAGELVRV